MRLGLACATLLVLCACATGDGPAAGQPCGRDADCSPLLCQADLTRLTSDLDPMPLACGAQHAHQPPGAACEQAEDCDHGLCLLAGACAQACRDGTDCSEGQRCQAVYTRSSAASLATASACVDAVNLPPDARIGSSVIDAAVSGGLDELSLPAFAPRTLYVLEHLGATSWPLPSTLSLCRPPLCAVALRTAHGDGEPLFARDALSDLPDGPDNPIAQGSHVNPLTVWIPNGPRVAAEPRDYRLQVESTQPGAVRVTSLARAEVGQRLDLNLYYVGAQGLAPEGTRGPPVLEAALEEVERIFEPADIFIGEVRQLTLPGMLAQRGSPAEQGEVSAGFARLLSQYQVLPELPELLRLSAGAANSALDVFFVADIESTTGADIGGIAGGTPVGFGMHGGPGSGIVIASDMYVVPGRASALGRTLAHEISHALGLFHTTEINGIVFDPLPDTPSCPIDQDRDHDGTLDASECAAYGGNNLLFPTSDAGDELTPEQCAVLRDALILQ